MALYTVTGEDLTSVADAIRAKVGVSGGLVYPDGFVDALDNMPDLYMDENGAIDFLLTGGLSAEYVNSEVTRVANGVFYGDQWRGMSLENCMSVGASAFRGCIYMSYIYAPKIETVGSYAFYSCYVLGEASFPNCSYIGDYAFYACSSLTSFPAPNVRYIGASAFYYGTQLQGDLSLNNCSHIGSAAFAYAKYSTISLKNIEIINQNAFYSMTNLTSFHIENIGGVFSTSGMTASANGALRTLEIYAGDITLRSSAFNGCSLKTIVLSGYSKISVYRYAFYSAYTGNDCSLYLLGSVVPSYFTSVFFPAAFPMTYVPASMYDAFMASASWAAISARITSIPDV